MSYQIDVLPSARKEIELLPGYARAQARELIRGLKENPYPPRAKELRGKPKIYRLWVATHWRIAYRVDDDLQQILILRVRRKGQIDYESL